MPTLSYTETLETCTCWCGIHLAIPANLKRIAHDEGKKIYCPLGHTFVYGNSYREQYEQEQEARARAERRAQAERDLRAAEERAHRATRGVVTKQRKKLERVTNGVCPCCNRTFQNLMRHMQSKHPDYTPERGAHGSSVEEPSV